MGVTENLRALERAVEKEIVAFFIRLGAGEAPESWRAEAVDAGRNATPAKAPPAPPRGTRH